VDYTIEENLPKLTGSEDEIVQVFNNLIGNSLQAMNFNGKLSIALTQDNKNIKVTITDSGGGVQSGDQDIFEPFFTTKERGEGTGLGLNISKVIVQKHNGDIYWENVGSGARFTFKLPCN
jgi:signal transduction histidine kinase